jgi:hypothetical protein
MPADMLSAVILSVAAAVPNVAAQTYKWVDAKGTVNYSSSPVGQAQPVQVVADRVSVIGPDPYFYQQAAELRRRETLRAESEERDWQRRQQALLYMQSVPTFAAAAYDPYPASWSYPATYYHPYYGPVYGGGYVLQRPVRPMHPIHPSRPPQVSHHASRGGGRGR